MGTQYLSASSGEASCSFLSGPAPHPSSSLCGSSGWAGLSPALLPWGLATGLVTRVRSSPAPLSDSTHSPQLGAGTEVSAEAPTALTDAWGGCNLKQLTGHLCQEPAPPGFLLRTWQGRPRPGRGGRVPATATGWSWGLDSRHRVCGRGHRGLRPRSGTSTGTMSSFALQSPCGAGGEVWAAESQSGTG